MRMDDTVLHTEQRELAEPQEFAGQFTSTPRGARLARRFAVRCLEEWGYPAASDVSCTVALLVAELASNAVCHGRVPGRDFRLRLSSDGRRRLIRIEVSDASSDRPPTSTQTPSSGDESGRGLLLVEVMAQRWGVTPRVPSGKTVWAEVAVEPAQEWLATATPPQGERVTDNRSVNQ